MPDRPRRPATDGYGLRVRERQHGVLAGWLALVAIGHVVAFWQVWAVFVRTTRGQLLDTVALAGTSIGQARVDGPVDAVLNAVSVASVLLATGVVAFIALVRRRLWLAAVTAVLICGANLTTQLLKHSIVRPEYGIDPDRAFAGNSFPSGHTTVAASVALALVLALPPAARGLGGVLGGAYAAIVGIGTLSAGWHRPSDAIGAYLVAGGWAALAGLALLVGQRRNAVVAGGDSARPSTVVLGVAGLVLVAVALVALRRVDQLLPIPIDQLGRRQLFVAYAGGAAGIAGSAALVTALVLSTAHRVVPALTQRPSQTSS